MPPAGRLTAAAAVALLTLALPLEARRTPATEGPPLLPGVPDGEILTTPGGRATELLTLPDELVAGLLDVALERSAVIDGWPLAPRERAAVVLTRHDVYARGAELWELRGNRRRAAPRSPWVFLWGAAMHDADVRVLVGVEPTSREVFGVAFTAAGAFEVRRPRESAQLAEGLYLVGPQWLLRGMDGERGDDWTCGQPGAPTEASIESLRGESRLGAVTGEAITTQHTATVAVETDNQFMAKFANDTAAASNYIASLLAQMNAIYQRDLLVRLVQGTTYLRTTPDPWTVNDAPPYSDASNWEKLQEFTNWWSANQAAVPRALALMLSGRGGAGAAGIAWVDALCSASHGYAFSRVGTTGTAPAATDVQVTAHEIGHVFGSPHTHCYNTIGLQNPDNCQSGETFANQACYSGAPQGPAQAVYQGVAARGTLMSYCHLLSGCSAATVFHPTSIQLLAPKIEAKTPARAGAGACIVPDVAPGSTPTIAQVFPNSGTTGGGTVVTITGSGFQAGATVTFGGTPGVSVSVASATRLTVVTPPHAAGAVAVVVTNPGGGSATLSPGFFYYPPPPALRFYTTPLCRVVDTRNATGPRGGPALAPNATRSFKLTGACAIPSGARSLAVNVTVTQPAAAGFLGVYPGDAFPLGTSNVSFRAGQTRAGFSVVTLAIDGSGTVLVTNGSGGPAHLILDVSGYFQ